MAKTSIAEVPFEVAGDPAVVEATAETKTRKASGPRTVVPLSVFVRVLNEDGTPVQAPRFEVVGSIKATSRADFVAYQQLCAAARKDTTVMELSITNGTISVVK